MKEKQDTRRIRRILLTLVTATAVNAQNYVVHLLPPIHAGQTYAVSTSGSKRDQTSIGDRVLKATEYQVNFEGRAEVLAVDGRQTPTRIAFTVERLTKIEGGVTIDLLKPGSVIITDGSQQQPISLKDGAIAESVREAFRLVHPAHKPGDVTDDDIFGTKDAKGIGDRWSINLALAAENLRDTGISIPAGRLSGTVSLVGKDKIAAIECLSIQGELRADGVTMKDLPPGFTMDRGSFGAVFRGCFPLGDSGLSYKEGADMIFQIRLTSKEGVSLDITTSEKRDAVWLAPGN